MSIKRNSQARKSGGLRPTTVSQFPRYSIFFRATAGRRPLCNKPHPAQKKNLSIWLRALDRVSVEIFVVTYEWLEFGLPSLQIFYLAQHEFCRPVYPTQNVTLKCHQPIRGFQFKTLRICQ
jgi:hypothetical protein